MRWWLYDGKKTTGPFSKQDLARLGDFSPESPLCREYTLGTPDEEWFRAVDIKEISPIFPPAIREKAASEPIPQGKPGPWPPDPTKRDLDAYGSVERRMEIVDRSIAAAQDRITLRTERFHTLQGELDRRLETADALEDKIRTMAAKIGGFVGLREELDQARAAMAMQQKRISDLHEQMKTLEAAPAPLPEIKPEEPPVPIVETEEKLSPRKRRRAQRRAKRRSKSDKPAADPFGTDLPNADIKSDLPEPF